MPCHASPRRFGASCCVVVVLCWLLSAAGARKLRGTTPGEQQPQPQQLEVRNYTYASFDKDKDAGTTLRVLKDAAINGGALQLTPDTRNNDAFLVHKSGSVLLATPFTLWRPLTDDDLPSIAGPVRPNSPPGARARTRVVSFNTNFTMNVFYDKASPGEGLTFLIAPSLAGPPPGSDDGFLGLTNATLETNPSKNRFVAIEFDTRNQTHDNGSNNHVGLDIGSVVSAATANLNVSIASNNVSAPNHTVWIHYDGVARRIAVYVGVHRKPKPGKPVLEAALDLSEHVNQVSYLGFSASTGDTFELNCILDWTLSIETFPEEPESKAWVIIVAVAVSVAVLAFAVAAFFLARLSRARRAMERSQEQLGQTLSHLPGMPREFAYDKLRKATKNFDERLKLGKGGYGVVYKGLLPAEEGRAEAMEVAVKRFTRDDARCVEDFVKEVDIINRLRHKNIVPLIGWCYKKGQLLLVYEYMPNGSLDQHLFRRGVHDQRPAPLPWSRRYSIIADIASGLHYVHHEYGRTVVLHRDIKASNVLLDASFRARLGDFGLARVIDLDRASFTDLGVAGTRGYIAPEYSVGHKATRQTDVFAFGALVLELVTGRYSLTGDPGCPMLADYVWRMHGRGALLGAVDQDLGTAEFDHDEATRMLLLGLACSSPNPGDRPTMPEVLQVLAKAAPPPEVPLFKPTFMWPPEGAPRFSIGDIELTSSTSTSGGAGGYSYDGGYIGVSTRATQDTSYDSFPPTTAPNDGKDYFPALSSGR
ncbi:probable L-type lectin-domain containing receptor kinase S.5 [Brachypodium distachyon]|nr:probable L-type lectin-domain containing receptor kinase S.5 [Brachypodium distachyon]|eukprot:XP_014755807.1 probable L-type lectin-domain containing receptor kinase S.5 [Brachypodium distachyon]